MVDGGRVHEPAHLLELGNNVLVSDLDVAAGPEEVQKEDSEGAKCDRKV